MRTLKILFLLIALGVVSPQAIQAVPYSITYAARLTDSGGRALTGTYNVRVRFYDAQTGGAQLVAGKQTSGVCTGSNYITSPLADSYQVSLTSGAFSRVIYFCQSDFNTLFPDSTTTPWIEVQSAPSSDTSFSGGSVVTYPRQQFTLVPYALKVPVDGSTMTYDSSGNLKVGTIQSYQINGTISSSQLPSSLSPTSVSASTVSASTIQITGGTPGAGKVLTSDENGNATWQNASSSGGADTTLRNLFLPPAPTNLTPTAGNAQVTLSWTAPTVLSQTPITNYSYQVSSNNGSTWGAETLTGSTSATATITGLTNGTSYVFKVAGVNAVGTGSYSNSSASVTPTVFICPSNYVKVGANTTLGTGEFCVAKYEMKNNGSNVAVSQASGNPWVSINRDNSIIRCQALGAKYDLISNAQWQAMAREIETAQSPAGTYLNWSNNSTSGTNYMNRGHSDSGPARALAASTDNDPCSGTGQTSCADNANAHFTQKRTHTLKSGEIIWDVAGNVWEWVKDNNNASQGADSYVSTNSWSDASKLKFGPEGSYSSKASGEYGGLGHGWLNYSAGAVLRGGAWDNGTKSGVFTAYLDDGPSFTYDTIGFRCVLLP